MTWLILETRSVKKELSKAPSEIADRYDAWVDLVRSNGPEALRKINGYRDHALKGEWEGARSSSLNYQWRVIYIVDGKTITITVVSVTPHDYRRKI